MPVLHVSWYTTGHSWEREFVDRLWNSIVDTGKHIFVVQLSKAHTSAQHVPLLRFGLAAMITSFSSRWLSTIINH